MKVKELIEELQRCDPDDIGEKKEGRPPFLFFIKSIIN